MSLAENYVNCVRATKEAPDVNVSHSVETHIINIGGSVVVNLALKIDHTNKKWSYHIKGPDSIGGHDKFSFKSMSKDATQITHGRTAASLISKALSALSVWYNNHLTTEYELAAYHG